MKWSTRIRQLQAQGWTLREIAAAIGLSKGAVGDLAVGKNAEPRYDAGAKLHALHLQYCGERPRGKRLRQRAG